MDSLLKIISFDYQVAGDIVFLRNNFLDSFFFFITQFGSWYIITILFIIVSWLFYIYKKKALILPLFVTVVGSGLITLIIKYLADRNRPDLGLSLYFENGSSFPSAHATLVFAFFGFLIYCVWIFDLKLKIKIVLSIAFFLVILLVGFSRVYLGVHFVSDIAAGYLTGLLLVLMVSFFSRKSFNILNHNRF